MRVLLAAIPAAKGDPSSNADAHAATLHEAAEADCDIAVFPEFSLTGSIDPAETPAAAVRLDDPLVERVVDATARTGVGAVFGIAERAEERFFITQLYACGGALRGHYRKRRLGEGEERFTRGDSAAAFRLGSARFAIAICAEGGADLAWAEAREAGAEIVFFCSAPGLYGRRTDEAAWREGLAWWEGCGLKDASRHARELGLWVAMTGQAGSNEDEDFPGLAALVDPGGNVVARLPDWHPGTLVVEVPIEVTVKPVREAVRTLVLDANGQALLVRFHDEVTGLDWWCPPGGGLESGEDHLAAARRELAEETGHLDKVTLGGALGWRTHTFCFNGIWMTQREKWIACRAQTFTISPERLAELRAEHVSETRWWSATELVHSGEVTAPRGLAALIEEVASGATPDPRRDLGR